jgi:hypothetical protein
MLVFHLRVHVEEFRLLAADASQEKLHLGLGKPFHSPLDPEW